MNKSSQASAGARTRARELMVQALYQKQIAGHTTAELVAQFREDTAYARVDQAFFDELAVHAKGSSYNPAAPFSEKRPVPHVEGKGDHLLWVPHQLVEPDQVSWHVERVQCLAEKLRKKPAAREA